MSLSATHSCDSRPNKNKPPSGEVLLWWTKGKPYYRTAEVSLTTSKVFIFRNLTRFALVPVPLSHCWLDTAGCNGERPAALCASHVGTQHAPGLLLLDPSPHPPLLNPSDPLPGTTTPGTHTSLYCLGYPLSGITEAAIVIYFDVTLLDIFHVMLF